MVTGMTRDIADTVCSHEVWHYPFFHHSPIMEVDIENYHGLEHIREYCPVHILQLIKLVVAELCSILVVALDFSYHLHLFR